MAYITILKPVPIHIYQPISASPILFKNTPNHSKTLQNCKILRKLQYDKIIHFQVLYWANLDMLISKFFLLQTSLKNTPKNSINSPKLQNLKFSAQTF